MQPTAGFMTYDTGRLTAKNRDQLRNPALGNRVWATVEVRGFVCAELNVSGWLTEVCVGAVQSRPVEGRRSHGAQAGRPPAARPAAGWTQSSAVEAGRPGAGTVEAGRPWTGTVEAGRPKAGTEDGRRDGRDVTTPWRRLFDNGERRVGVGAGRRQTAVLLVFVVFFHVDARRTGSGILTDRKRPSPSQRRKCRRRRPASQTGSRIATENGPVQVDCERAGTVIDGETGSGILTGSGSSPINGARQPFLLCRHRLLRRRRTSGTTSSTG